MSMENETEEITGHYPTERADENAGLHIWPFSCYHARGKWWIVASDDTVCAVVEDTFLTLDDDEREGETGAGKMARHIVDLLNANFIAEWKERHP